MNKIQLLGPYNSGTNLLLKIFDNNINPSNVKYDHEGSTILWKHQLNKETLEKTIIENQNTLFLFMYRPCYHWSQSIKKAPYDIKWDGNIKNTSKIYYKTPKGVVWIDYTHDNIVKLFEQYYDTYMYLLEKYPKNTCFIEYNNLIYNETAYDYINSKISKFGFTLISKEKTVNSLTKPCKWHGKPVNNNNEAIKKLSIPNDNESREKIDFISKTLNNKITKYFESGYINKNTVFQHIIQKQNTISPQSIDSPLKIYVGVTCLPGRENNFEKCLNSFLEQKRLPEKVFISYCKNYRRFPDKKFDTNMIEKFKQYPIFEFIESEEDYGPATKFIAPIHRLKEIEKDNLENVHLIVCDDDRTYYDYFINRFHGLISENNEKVYTGYLEIIEKNKNLKIAFGADGYNIKGSWFDKLLNWYNKMLSIEPEGKETWYHDDYTCSSFFHYNLIPVQQTMKKSCHHSYVDEVSLTSMQHKKNDGRRSRLNSKCGICYCKIRSQCENNQDDRNKYIIKNNVFYK
jgi:hypothetical protein